MIKQRQDKPKLQTFSLNTIDVYENEIIRICKLCRDNRISTDDAMNRLNRAKNDLLLSYYYTSQKILETQDYLRSRSDYLHYELDSDEEMTIKKLIQ
jgi:hypothetical protein